MAPALFGIGVFAGGVIEDGYSHVEQVISELGAIGASTFWLQNSLFVLVGLAMLAFSLALRRSVTTGGAVTVLVLVAGMGFVGTGLTPCTSGCPLPGTEPGATLRDAAHTLFASAVLLPLIAAPLVVARRSREHGRAGYARYSLMTGFVSLASFLVFVSVAEPAGFEGLAQRVTIGASLLWLAVTAGLLLVGRFAGATVPGGAAPHSRVGDSEHAEA